MEPQSNKRGRESRISDRLWAVLEENTEDAMWTLTGGLGGYRRPVCGGDYKSEN